jgi:hypothetical protein
MQDMKNDTKNILNNETDLAEKAPSESDEENLGGPEGKRPDRQDDEAPEGASAGGCSNTPHRQLFFNTCIDYLKFRFSRSYTEEASFFEELLKILSVDLSESAELPGINGYTVKLELGPGLSLWYGGTITKDCYGHATTVLEMKGEACRDFEERRFFQEENAEQKDWDAIIRKGWLDLLVEARRMEGQCTRVDLPTDDLSGTITTDLIKAKVQNREYTTKMRRLEVTDETDMNLFNGASESLPGYASILDSKLKGYSATFGSRDSMQLCIYDKAAERTVRGFVVDVKSWIRFEVRYYHKNAEAEIPFLITALENGTESEHIVGCLATAIEFKEPNNCDQDHRSEAKSWGKWDDFLRGVRKNEPFAHEEPVYAIETNAKWLVKEAAKAIARLSLATNFRPELIAKALCIKGCQRINKTDFQSINRYRRERGKHPIHSVDALVAALFGEEGEASFPKELEGLLKTK